MGGIDAHKSVLTILDRDRVRQRVQQHFGETLRFLHLFLSPFVRGDITRDAAVSGEALVGVKHRGAAHADIDELAVLAGVTEFKVVKRRMRFQHPRMV